MKIYTKTGDQGETGLMGGKRLRKNALRIAAYGNVDELNAYLGVCRTVNTDAKLESILHGLQQELFALGADLSTPLDEKHQVPRVKKNQVEQFERWIDELDAALNPLRNFILPGGTQAAAHLQVARAVCRRAERSIVALEAAEPISEHTVKYVNRLSDLLFVMARYANHTGGVDEERWKA